MKNTNQTQKNQAIAKVLTVTVLLSLGLESTTRDYKLIFSENAQIDEQKEALEIVKKSRKNYTSIMHLGGSASLLTSTLTLETVKNKKPVLQYSAQV